MDWILQRPEIMRMNKNARPNYMLNKRHTSNIKSRTRRNLTYHANSKHKKGRVAV